MHIQAFGHTIPKVPCTYERPIGFVMRKYKVFEGKRRMYDTEKSTVLGTRSFGYFGDPAGYEETLYQTPKGFYFVMGKGGEESPYANDDDVHPISAEEAAAWQE